MSADKPNFVKCSIFNSLFIGFEIISIYWSVQSGFIFLCYSNLVDSNRLRLDYGIIRG